MKSLYESILSSTSSGIDAYLPEYLAEKFYTFFKDLKFENKKIISHTFRHLNGGNILFDKRYERNVQNFIKELDKLKLYHFLNRWTDNIADDIYEHAYFFISDKNKNINIVIKCTYCEERKEQYQYTTVTYNTKGNDSSFLRFIVKLDALYNKI